MILKTAIVADTNSNLTPQMAEELDVKLIPMPFFIGGETYLEGSTCTHSMFFEKLREGAEVFTSQPPLEQITHLWDLLLRDHDCILHFPMSSGLSGSCQTAKALATTRQVKEAKNTVTQIIEDTWNEYTGDVNNILLMDATAEPVSLTDERNPAPTSIQVLIRTQEIKEEKAEENETSAAAKENTTFWGRVSQMFRDFWNAVTGIFH